MAEHESSDITSRPPRADITRKLVQPPARVYMTLDDQLYIRSRNSVSGVVLRIAGRVLTPDGEIVPFNYEHTPATDRSASLEAFRMAEGYLLSAVVFPSVGAPLRGQTFVELGFLRGIAGALDIVDVLAKDYVAEDEPLAFPGSPIRSSLEGPGAILSLTGTDPSAGADISETVPTDARWHFLGMRVVLVTDATVINRFAVLTFDDGATIHFSTEMETAITANSTIDINVGADVHRSVFTFPLLMLATPLRFPMGAGHRIQTAFLSLQAGDNFGAPQLLVEEWIED